jgi:hypothetical protein
LGYVGAVPHNRVVFEIQLFFSGEGSTHALNAAPAATTMHQPLPRETAKLFATIGKGPRADRYAVAVATTSANKEYVAASAAGATNVTGSISWGGGVKKGDRLSSGITSVALGGPMDQGFADSLFFTASFNKAFGFAATPPPEAIAYHPTEEALSFKYKGESQAEFEERERRCLATAIYFEARGEPVRGQIAVGQVILNRVRSPRFPSTICGVVYQGQGEKGCQFSFACDGKSDMPKDDEQWALAQEIARQITSGKVWLPDVGYSTYYHANYVRPGWADAMNKIDSIGRHIFYKKRNETPYVVEAEDSTTSTAPAPALSLASSSPSSDGAIASPALSLGLSPSE